MAAVTVTFVILSYNYIIQCQSNSVLRLAPVYQTQRTDDDLIITRDTTYRHSKPRVFSLNAAVEDWAGVDLSGVKGPPVNNLQQ